MPRPASSLYARLSRMTWDEFHTRLRQEIGKRMDAALCRVGLQPGRNGLRSNARAGNFFFSPEELSGRVSLLRHHLPQEVDAIIHEADEICRHHFRLLGYENLDYGGDIDWHLDAVHGKRTPLVPWYKIDFLDFTVAGDHKITWELNRHQHLVTLAKAWLFTQDQKYANEAISQWYSWQRANPYPLGINWASSLEVAFRSLSWLWTRNLLSAFPTLPAAFSADLQRALALNGRHIERYLSTYFSPNTHLLGEAVALFFIGTLCPQLPAAEKWKRQGWQIILREAGRQVRPDGVYFEQSLYYHVYALDFLLHARVLAAQNAVEIPSTLDLVIRRMLAVIGALAQAGPPDGFGDDDGGRLFNPRRNRAEHMTDPVHLGAALFPDELPLTQVTPTEEAIWLLGQPALDPHGKTVAPIPASLCFPDGGLCIAASAAPFPQQMVIDAGPQGTGGSGHGHADALSVKLSFAGRRWLVDAGTFAYITAGTERQHFRGTRAHNTLAVDGLDQAQPEGPFAWSHLPVTVTESWIPASTFTFFAGSHSGYERLVQPVRHRRFVFHLHGSFWMIRDVVEGTGTHRLETSWHFAHDLQLSASDKIFVASPRQDPTTELDAEASTRLTLFPVSDPEWKCELRTEEISPAYGIRVPAPVIRCAATFAAPAEHAMLVLPENLHSENMDSENLDSEKPRAFSRINTLSDTKPIAAYSYQDGECSHTMIFARPNAAQWTFGPWTTDALFLFIRVRDRRVTQLACCGATFLHLRSDPVFSSAAKVKYVEWTNRPDDRRLLVSEPALVPTISETVLEARFPG